MSDDIVTKLHTGFRERYLDYAELTAQLEAWAKAFPEFVRLESIGRSEQGRELWLATLGPEPDRARPAVWVDANMHATELCGTKGYLPSYILASARKLDWNEPLYAEIQIDGGELASGQPPRRELGHLDGWGRGLYTGQGTPWFQRSRGSTATRHLSWLVRGSGTVHVRAGACRVGFVTHELSVG